MHRREPDHRDREDHAELKAEDEAGHYEPQGQESADDQHAAQEREIGPCGKGHDREAREEQAGDEPGRRDHRRVIADVDGDEHEGQK